MILTHLPKSTYSRMPWKNGGGATTEIAIRPGGSELQDPFIWRASIAQIQGSGPFSSFDGCERLIVQLSGSPLVLDHGIHGQTQLEPFVAHRFQGEWATEATLQGAAAEDFNLIVRRHQAQAELTCEVLASNSLQEIACEPTLLLWIIAGYGELKIGTRTLQLAPRDACILEEREDASPPGLPINRDSSFSLCSGEEPLHYLHAKISILAKALPR